MKSLLLGFGPATGWATVNGKCQPAEPTRPQSVLGRMCNDADEALLRSVLLACLGAGLCLSATNAVADGVAGSAEQPIGIRGSEATVKPAARKHVRRDPLAIDEAVSVQNKPAPAVDLPGVLKLEGADRDLLDTKRVRKISWTNGASQTVWVSSTQPNRIQLPFSNPRVISTSELQIDKKAGSNNVYVFFAPGVAHAVQIWLEPPGESSTSIGLELVPKTMPAQQIVVVDDTVAGSAGRAQLASPENEYLTRVQALLEQAALGASPEGYSVVDLQLPPMAVNGLAIEGLRRLSSRSDDIYVYTVSNPGAADVLIHEREFDGEDVRAVSIVPKPLLHPGEKSIVTILAKKHEAR